MESKSGCASQRCSKQDIGQTLRLCLFDQTPIRAALDAVLKCVPASRILRFLFRGNDDDNDDDDNNNSTFTAQSLHDVTCLLFYFPVIPDRSWLSCEHFRKESFLGWRHSMKDMTFRFFSVTANENNGQSSTNGSDINGGVSPCKTCPFPVQTKITRPIEYPPTCGVDDKNPTARCIDFRGYDNSGNDFLQEASSAQLLHFLRSLLGCSNSTSPWTLEEDTTTNTCDEDCVVLVFDTLPEKLVEFRVGDASPSWCLLCYCCDQQISTEANAKWNLPSLHVPAVLVYRRLLKRTNLMSKHPLTQEPVPFANCLWEAYVDRAQAAQEEDPEKEPTILFRVTAPPYIDYDTHLRHTQLHTLLEPDNLALLQQEALAIAHWTAWPETQHYQPTSTSAVPWNVFPLAHSFKGGVLSWIQKTSPACPHTIRLLRELVGPNVLRTVLWSRLDAGAVLEAHSGWADLANYVIRVHIPIVVPVQEHVCGTWVDGCAVTTTPKTIVAFDDSKTHRAFHYGTDGQARIVLIVDVARPDSLPIGTATGGHSDELDAMLEQFG